MDSIEQDITEAAGLIELGKAKEALSLLNATLESYVRHMAIAEGAVQHLADGNPDRLSAVSDVQFIDFLVERGILRHRQKSDIREIHRQVTVAEREHVGPSLEQANDALRFLREFVDRNETTARDLMGGPVIGLDRDRLIEDVLALMRVRGIRHIPVTEKGKPVRSVEPETILRLLDEGTSDLARTPVWDIADRGMPKVAPDARLPELLRLLRTNAAVLVVEAEKIIGIVSASDVLQVVRRYQ